MTAKLVKIEDVKLQSLQVNISAMTVNGKQMTLSLFRQLPEACPLGFEFQARGKLWGYVRYSWGDQAKDAIHIVWQGGDSLYRWVPSLANFGKINSVEWEAHVAERSGGRIEYERTRVAAYGRASEEHKRWIAVAEKVLPQLFIAI